MDFSKKVFLRVKCVKRQNSVSCERQTRENLWVRVKFVKTFLLRLIATCTNDKFHASFTKNADENGAVFYTTNELLLCVNHTKERTTIFPK